MSEREVDSDGESLPSVAERLLSLIREDMRDTWRLDDQLLKKFFPVESSNSELSPTAKARKRLYNDKRNGKRWKGVPSGPKTASRLYTALRTLMNNILRCHGISRHNRLFLDTHTPKKSVVSMTASPVSPSLFLAGVGDEFANTSAEKPEAFAHCGISPIEIILDSDDYTGARDRLAANMHQIFQNQDNRRFAYGLVLTESMATVYMFDHSGAVASEPFNYHQQPEQFCAVISQLASDDAQSIGFDLSMFSDGTSTKIRTCESSEDGSLSQCLYTIKERLFLFPCLIGRGTICWLTSGLNDSESTFVIKDAWIAPEELDGRESEGSLLRHAKCKGVVLGVAQVRHFEEIHCGTGLSDLDTVLHNRRAEGTSPDDIKLDRIHTRIVMETHGKTLDEFLTRKELLLAFHDAVLAHRNLHDVAGILHRDISIRNILINSEGVEGNRGILIDFDHSIRIGDTSPYSTKNKIGTFRYRSRNVLDAQGPHTYLDDLESFYYVLCWILVAYEGPGIGRAEIPELVSLWDDRGSSVMKYGFLGRKFALPTASWFDGSIHRLAVHLHGFFQSRFKAIGKPLSALNPANDYDEYLGHIQQAITELEKEAEHTERPPSSPDHIPSKPFGSDNNASRKRAREVDTDESFMTLDKRRRRGLPASLKRVTVRPSSARPKRSTVKYD